MFLLLNAGLLCAATSSDAPLHFEQDPLTLGSLDQGSIHHVVLKGRNTSKQVVRLESVMSQNVGASDFVYPKTITSGTLFQVEFNLNTAGIEGLFTQRIILVEEGGHPLVTTVEGTVESPLRFSQQILDAGYLTIDSKPTWTIYAWNPKGAHFKIALDSAAQQSATLQTSEVMLNTEKFDDVREGGTTPGLKLTLSANPLSPGTLTPTGKSFRKIIGFHTETWPQAAPEILIVGFWK